MWPRVNCTSTFKFVELDLKICLNADIDSLVYAFDLQNVSIYFVFISYVEVLIVEQWMKGFKARGEE